MPPAKSQDGRYSQTHRNITAHCMQFTCSTSYTTTCVFHLSVHTLMCVRYFLLCLFEFNGINNYYYYIFADNCLFIIRENDCHDLQAT